MPKKAEPGSLTWNIGANVRRLRKPTPPHQIFSDARLASGGPGGTAPIMMPARRAGRRMFA
jgi:hypothetical protein